MYISNISKIRTFEKLPSQYVIIEYQDVIQEEIDKKSIQRFPIS